MDLQLNHFAYRITPGSLEFVLELFERMGCSVCYADKKQRWGLVQQNKMYVQFIETAGEAAATAMKENAHIAFLSADPRADIDQIRQWVCSRSRQLVQGSWSEKEHWFDVPDAFTDFVVEIMQPAGSE